MPFLHNHLMWCRKGIHMLGICKFKYIPTIFGISDDITLFNWRELDAPIRIALASGHLLSSKVMRFGNSPSHINFRQKPTTTLWHRQSAHRDTMLCLWAKHSCQLSLIHWPIDWTLLNTIKLHYLNTFMRGNFLYLSLTDTTITQDGIVFSVLTSGFTAELRVFPNLPLQS